jgi:Zn-dependent peptidase ImmA (M78 family)
MSRKDIRKLAFEVRRVFMQDKSPYFDIVRFVENGLSYIWSDYDYEICAVDEMNDNHGLTDVKKHTIKIREDVYEGAVAGNGRDRFTLAHEVGHLIIHSGQNFKLARGKIKVYEDPEWQADVFGGELLVPAHLMKGASLEDIIMDCGVSTAAARCQIKQLYK